MKPGKLTIEQLRKIVFPYTGQRRTEVLVHASIGEDCAVVDLKDQLCVISTDPITGASKDKGYLGVHVACNDVIASGGKPLGILVTLLLKEDTTEEDIRTIIEGTNRACLELGIEIIGGHTEITGSVKESILSLTALGTKDRRYMEKQTPIAPGDEIFLTKGGGIEGTAILYNDFEDRFKGLVPSDLIERGQSMVNDLSVFKEGTVAINHGAKMMHDVTEGGILGGLYELVDTTDLGIRIEEEAIFFHPATWALKQVLPDLDLLRLISSGSLLIIAPPGNDLQEALKDAGVTSYRIGRFTQEKERILQRKDGTDAIIKEPKSDALWSAMEQLKKEKE